MGGMNQLFSLLPPICQVVTNNLQGGIILNNYFLFYYLKERLVAVLYIFWVLIIIIELFFFFNTIHTPHSISDVVFNVTVIVVTLAVGITGLFLFRKYREYNRFD